MSSRCPYDTDNKNGSRGVTPASRADGPAGNSPAGPSAFRTSAARTAPALGRPPAAAARHAGAAIPLDPASRSGRRRTGAPRARAGERARLAGTTDTFADRNATRSASTWPVPIPQKSQPAIRLFIRPRSAPIRKRRMGDHLNVDGHPFSQLRPLHRSRALTRTGNLPVNSRTLCRLSYAGSTPARTTARPLSRSFRAAVQGYRTGRDTRCGTGHSAVYACA